MEKRELEVQIPEQWQALVSAAVFESYEGLACGEPSPNEPMKGRLADLQAGDLFQAQPTNLQMANCCLSGLWLLNGFLDESHEISQSISTAEGSFWHGIMHRLEGDFWNSKYWYRKVGDHAVIQDLCSRHAEYPDKFVDATEQAFGTGASREVAAVAIEEWIRLFEFCYQAAV